MTAEPSIAIVDYGMGNLRSVEKALEHVGHHAVVTSDAAVISRADGVILPGVGAFGDAMAELRSRSILDVVRQRAIEARDGGRPFLGICLGMQVLVDRGEESGGCVGMGVIPGECNRLIRPGLKVPHMGWNALQFTQDDCSLFSGLPSSAYVYFVHSYAVVPQQPDVVSAVVDYGGEVVAALHVGNLYATQFHPEKSQEVGLQMLANFGRLLHAVTAA